MWEIPGKAIEATLFQTFEAMEVLYDFDGPRVFTLQDKEGEAYLSYWSDEDEQISRYVVVPTTGRILTALRRGEMSVYDALDQPRCWLCDVSPDGVLARCQRVDFEAIPRDALPNPATMLWPELEPQRVDFEGRIRELDKDRLSFELREIDGMPQYQRFVFNEELLDDVSRAFQDDVRVRVASKTLPVKNLAHALALSRVAIVGQ